MLSPPKLLSVGLTHPLEDKGDGSRWHQVFKRRAFGVTHPPRSSGGFIPTDKRTDKHHVATLPAAGAVATFTAASGRKSRLGAGRVLEPSLPHGRRVVTGAWRARRRVAPVHRIDVLDELARRFPIDGTRWWQPEHWRANWKRGAWRFATHGARVLKRTLDIVGAMVALFALWPLLLLVAVAIKAQDGGPVLFWQKRVGRWGREFAFPKFRSMTPDAEGRKKDLLAHSHHGEGGVTFKVKRDPRTTPLGGLLRRSSIDELPQLWCVLTGDMSLVGPRPPVPQEVARYRLRDRYRLGVQPGLTCIWQVSGRSDIGFDRQIELDIAYVRSQSFWTDLKLLARTVPAVLGGRGAY